MSAQPDAIQADTDQAPTGQADADQAPTLSGEVVSEGTAEAFIPYPQIGESLEHVPIGVRPEVHYYQSRMGFLPNTIKLYLHVPWAAENLIRLNNSIMRHESSTLSEEFKYRLAAIVSRDNECQYCTAHHVGTLRKRFGYEEGAVEQVLQLSDAADEREAAAIDFAHRASLDPVGVTDELREGLAEHFTPQEVMEIACVVGFWKMYNTIHTALAAPLEDPVADLSDWVNVQPAPRH